MLNVLNCIATEHDPRLILLAAVICLIGSATTSSLWRHMRRLPHPIPRTWLFLTAATAASTIWVTHFTAMLAYVGGSGLRLSLVWTLLSLAVCFVLSACATLALLAVRRTWRNALAASALLALAIAGMHFTGIYAYRTSAILLFDPGYVVAAVAVAFLFGLATVAAFRRRGLVGFFATSLGFAFAIIGLHFTGMTALTVVPLAAEDGLNFESSRLLLPGIVAAVVVITASAAVAMAVDRRRLGQSLIEAARLRQLTVELEHTRDLAEQANQAKSAFLARMSHEIRTPLNGLLGMAEVLGLSQLTDEQRDCLRTIDSCGKALLSIVGDILDFERIEAGRVDFESVRVDLLDLIEGIVSAAGAERAGCRVRIYVRYPMTVPRYFWGDPERLRQVLANLIGNALKFTDEGHVLIEVSAPDADRVEVAVADTGIGIEEGRLAHIFEAFAQADQSITRRFGGTGLGLAIARSLAEQMGGGISVCSRPGQGSRFVAQFRLPVAGFDDTAKPTEERYAVVCRHQLGREILAETVRGLGGAVVAFSSVAEAKANMSWQELSGLILDCDSVPDILPEIERALLLMPPGTLCRSNHDGCTISARPVRRDILRAWLTHSQAARRPVALTTDEAGRSRCAQAVLIVDDSAVNRTVLRKFLPQEIEVEEAEDGVAALAAVGRRSFDLIFMDVSMPEMDGYEATRAILAFEAQAGRVSPPIIGVTAHAVQGELDRCLAAGMRQALVKPVRRQTILEVLERVLPLSAAPADNTRALTSAVSGAGG